MRWAVVNMEDEKRMTKMEGNIEHMMSLLLDIKDTLKNMDNTYVRKTELVIMLAQIQDQVKALQNSKNNMPNWISSIVAIVAVVIAYFK
jgi:hypothetical protein